MYFLKKRSLFLSNITQWQKCACKGEIAFDEIQCLHLQSFSMDVSPIHVPNRPVSFEFPNYSFDQYNTHSRRDPALTQAPRSLALCPFSCLQYYCSNNNNNIVLLLLLLIQIGLNLTCAIGYIRNVPIAQRALITLCISAWTKILENTGILSVIIL